MGPSLVFSDLVRAARESGTETPPPSCLPIYPAAPPPAARTAAPPILPRAHLLLEAPPHTWLQVRVALSGHPRPLRQFMGPRGPTFQVTSQASLCPHLHPIGHQVLPIQHALNSSFPPPGLGHGALALEGPLPHLNPAVLSLLPSRIFLKSRSKSLLY